MPPLICALVASSTAVAPGRAFLTPVCPPPTPVRATGRCTAVARTTTLLHFPMTSLSGLRAFPARDVAANGKPAQSDIVHLSVNATGSRVINTRSDRTIRIWRCSHATLSDPVVVENPHRGPATCVSWNPNTETSFASVGGDSTIKLWRGTGHLEREVKAEKPDKSDKDKTDKARDALCLVAYSPDGRFLAVADLRGTVRLHDVSSGYTVAAEVETALAVNALQWVNKGHSAFFTGHVDGHVKVWVVEDSQIAPGRVLTKHHAPVTCLCMDPRGRYVACGASDGTVSLWRTSDMTNCGVLAGEDRDICSVSPSRDGAYLAVAYGDGTSVKLFDYATLAEVYEVPGLAPGRSGGRAVWLPNRTALVVTDRGTVMLMVKREDR